MMSIKVCVLFVCLFAVVCDGASVFRKRRTVENESAQTSKDICVRNTPCGWAVYHRFTRDIDYFMKNKCECPEDKKCIRTDDDISVTAYVYRCKEPWKDSNNES